MSFLDKGSLSIVAIILIAVVIGFTIGSGGFFYWHKTYVPADNPPENISREEIKAKCLENVSKMTDEELINEVKNFKNSNEISVSTKENLLTPLYKNMINYLICKVEHDKGEENYNRAKNFMESLAYTSEENKQSVLDKLDDAHKVVRKNVQNSFTLQLALGDWNNICPNKLTDLCLADLNINNIDDEIFFESCKNICNTIKQYEDQDKLNSNIINIEEWVDSEDALLYKKQYRFRTAIAYHFGKKDLALKVCDNVNDSEKNNCLEWIDIIKIQENKNKERNDTRNELNESVCNIGE